MDGVSGMTSGCEHGLEDKEDIERVGDETCPEIGMGGCGNLNCTLDDGRKASDDEDDVRVCVLAMPMSCRTVGTASVRVEIDMRD